MHREDPRASFRSARYIAVSRAAPAWCPHGKDKVSEETATHASRRRKPKHKVEGRREAPLVIGKAASVCYFGGTAPAAGQSTSPTRLRRISKICSGSRPGTIRSPTSCSSPSLTVAT